MIGALMTLAIAVVMGFIFLAVAIVAVVFAVSVLWTIAKFTWAVLNTPIT